MDNGAITEYLNIRRCPANMVAWKDIAAELDMTISQLEYWRRKNDWVDKYPPSQVVSRRSQSLSIVDGEVSSALSRGLLANLPLTSIGSSLGGTEVPAEADETVEGVLHETVDAGLQDTTSPPFSHF